MSKLYIGLISGTSVDSIDAVLARIGNSSVELVGARSHDWPPQLQQRINALIAAPAPDWRELGALHIEIGKEFADAALALLAGCHVEPDEVSAIGHHGQTVYHAPDGPAPFTLQIGDANTVAARTGITTIADLRGYDMAVGGQGAPLVSALHNHLLRRETEARVVLNIGGIANITTLLPDSPIRGCDTGPGNTLLDAWTRRHRGDRFDDRGQWAATGNVFEPLLKTLLSEPWLTLPAPKSTGRELFNEAWLDRGLAGVPCAIEAEDVQATLAELTALTIADCISRTAPSCERIIVCGGGVNNEHLIARLRRHCGVTVESTAKHGVAPEWIEALAFAWLARARLNEIPGNVPSVTGAHQPAILGSIYLGANK